MKIRCIANTGAAFPESYFVPHLYICDDNYTYFPIQNPAPLFKIVDPTPSQYWQTQIAPNGLLEIAFEHWFSIPYYYDKLTDQEEEAVAIFEKYKELMDAEAASTPPPPLTVEELLAISLSKKASPVN